VATLQVSDDPNFVLTISLVTSSDLLSNLNRWEGQVGLPPTAAAEAEKKTTPIEVDGHTGWRMDLAGETTNKLSGAKTPSRMLAVLVSHGPGEAWTFKLQGAPDKLGEQASAFDAFVRSVHFLSHDHGSDAPAAAAAQPTPNQAPQPAGAPGAQDLKTYKLAGFTPPPGWEQDKTERQFRSATFYVGGAGNERAEVIVTKLPMNRFGTMLDNINLWRQQVGLPPTDDENKENVSEATVAGARTILFDFAGPQAAADVKRSYVAMLVKGPDVWFVKLIGPAKTVADQRANFDAFLQSLQFGEAGE
jgi:hypothetical protein